MDLFRYVYMGKCVHDHTFLSSKLYYNKTLVPSLKEDHVMSFREDRGFDILLSGSGINCTLQSFLCDLGFDMDNGGSRCCIGCKISVAK